MAKGNSQQRCAICRKPVSPDSADFPFCGERCRMADLGLWMMGSYRIPRALNPLDGDSFDPEGIGLPGVPDRFGDEEDRIDD